MSTPPRAKVRASSAVAASIAATPDVPSPGLLPAPGWSHVRRIALFRREVREVLAPHALDLLWSRREEMIEGSRELGRKAEGERYFASVMVTIELRRCEALFAEPCDAATATLLAELLGRSRALHDRLVALVRPELAGLSARPAETLEISLEHRVRADDTCLLIDGDAMTIASPTASRLR
ncbi:MAG: hypothetical protein R3B09_08015 [Nannocystaceae bacterium]